MFVPVQHSILVVNHHFFWLCTVLYEYITTLLSKHHGLFFNNPHLGVSIVMGGVPQNGWLIRENRCLKMVDHHHLLFRNVQNIYIYIWIIYGGSPATMYTSIRKPPFLLLHRPIFCVVTCCRPLLAPWPPGDSPLAFRLRLLAEAKWGFPWPWGYPNSWLVFVRENPIWK